MTKGEFFPCGGETPKKKGETTRSLCVGISVINGKGISHSKMMTCRFWGFSFVSRWELGQYKSKINYIYGGLFGNNKTKQ